MGRSSATASDDLHAAVVARLRVIGSTYPAKRRLLVDLLATAPQPLAMAQILERDRSLAQSSVYRNLAVLEQAGVVHRIVTGDDSARYELAEELSGHHHHHLICTSCGSVADVTLPDSVEATVDHELSKLARRHGFTATAHHLDLVGGCADCSA